MRESKGRQQFGASLRLGLITLCAVYLLGLASYLGLRGVFGGRYWWLALLNDFAVVWFLPLPLVLALGIRLRLRRIFMAGLCLILVGGLWFGPYFLLKSSVQAFAETLAVVSFNVWGDNARLAEVEAWLRESNADMVLLQEVPPTYADQTLPGLADMYPYQVGQSTSERLWGNLFLSRYPILAVETLPGTGVPAQQRIVVAYPGQHLALYNLHLATPIGAVSRFPQLKGHFVLDVALSYDNSARDAEIRRLLERLRGEPYPFIVAGDFNMSEQAAIYGEVSQQMGDAFREAGSGWGGSWPISVVDELPKFIPPLLRVDYIWYSSHFQAIEAYRGPQLGSDHLPLYAVLGVRF